MNKPRIGIVRGGPSSEYEISLGTGAAVLDAMDRERYEPLDIVIDRGGVWHIHGLPQEPHQALRRVDAVFNALHGAYGEDGKLQQLLEAHGMPFTGSGALASAVGMNKALAKERFRQAGLRTPLHIVVERHKIEAELAHGGDAAGNAYRAAHARFALPYAVKPVSGGSSVGTSVVKNRDEFAAALVRAFGEAAGRPDAVMIEEFISGAEATVGVIQDWRGRELYALPAVEMHPRGRDFFDGEAKYAGASDEIVPADFPADVKDRLEAAAIAAHQALGLAQYSRSDFIIHPRRGVYILETNTLPGLAPASLIPKALAATGSSLREFVGHLIELALG